MFSFFLQPSFSTQSSSTTTKRIWAVGKLSCWSQFLEFLGTSFYFDSSFIDRSVASMTIGHFCHSQIQKGITPYWNLQWVCLIIAKTGQLKNVLLFDFKPSPFQGASFWLLLHIIFNNFHCFYKIGSNKHLINYVISVEVCKVLCVLVSCLYSLSWDVLPHGNVKTTQYTNRPTKQLWQIHEKRTTTRYNRERILCSIRNSNTTTIKVVPKTAIKVTQLATISGEEDRLTR